MGSHELAVVGASWGGFHALAALVADIEPETCLAVAMVQHRAPGSDDGFPRFLQGRCRLPLEEVDDKVPIEPGHVYLAPPDYHLLVEPGHFSLSVDVLFETAADAYGERLVAVVLTGSNDDGCRGLARVKETGGFVLVQDPATAERPEMPAAAVATGLADQILPLDQLAAVLNKLGTRDA